MILDNVMSSSKTTSDASLVCDNNSFRSERRGSHRQKTKRLSKIIPLQNHKEEGDAKEREFLDG